MNKTTLFLFLSSILSIGATAQERQTFEFDYKGQSIDYTRIDYSKYGIQHHDYIFASESDYELMIDRVASCMAAQSRIYHTYFFIILVPEGLNNLEKQLEFLIGTSKEMTDQHLPKPLYVTFFANSQLQIGSENLEKQMGLNEQFYFHHKVTPKKWCGENHKSYSAIKKRRKEIEKANKKQ
jgi:hypothetical protein